MASFLKKTMLYLGLGPDDEYDVYDETPETVSDRRDRDTSMATVTRVAPRLPHPPEPNGGSVRAIRVGPVTGSGTATATMSSAAAVGLADPVDVRPTRATSSVVRPIPREAVAPVKPHSVTPLSFNDAQEIADWFKNPQPVIVNLEAAQRDLRRRLIDFCSGLCYGLGGQMERVADHVYLLTPSNVELSPEERRRLEHGID
jgi:cell division inhibitor SepF